MGTTRKLRIGPENATRLRSLTTTSGRTLTEAERRHLERQCNSRFNWSDGGHWIGMGPEPNCFQSAAVTGGATMIYEFPTDAAAFKWNDEWQKVIMRAGHLATAVITVIVTLKTGGLAGIAVGTIAAITKDELQANISYPRVARDWKYVVTINHTFKWSPHPWGKSEFFQEVSGTTFDTAGQKQYRSVGRTDLDLETFPETLAIELASLPGKTIRIQYR